MLEPWEWAEILINDNYEPDELVTADGILEYIGGYYEEVL